MLNLLNKRQDNAAVNPTPAKTGATNAREFLPAFIHYNAHTLLTRDGGVMQTIRIGANKDGLDYEAHDKHGGNLRDSIRKALATHIPGDQVAIWIHTLRKRRGVTFHAHYDNAFAAHVDAKWKAQNGWAHQYYNEVYITLVYDGQTARMADNAVLKEGVTLKKNRMMRNIYIESAANEMDLMMNSIIDDLSNNYQVHRLGVVERMAEAEAHFPTAPIFYSEPMEFLSYLLNLREEQVPLPDADIGDALQSSALIFGFNALETKNDAGVKRFGALLSLKQYREVPSLTVDMLLQAPMELIISQAFHFIPGDVALKEYRTQKDYFDMSGDVYSMQASGLEEMLRANRRAPTDFGSQQTSIMVVVDELKKIESDIGQLQKAFSSIGLVCVHEDIRQEEIFWSTFPGNFVFLRRKTSIPTSRIGGFAKLNRFPSGRSTDNFWPEPIALLPTLVNSPYFFNFHVQDNGHTLWLDFNSFNDGMSNQALSFLLTESQKLAPRVIYFDHHSAAELWFGKMGARYHHLHAKTGSSDFALNPFALPADARNISFLTAWCSHLIDASADERDAIKSALGTLYASGGTRHLQSFTELLATLSPALAARFAPWLEDGAYGGLFSAAEDAFPDDRDWLGIDLTEALATPNNAVAAFAYLLHRIILSLDGSPTVIVLQHAFPMLQQPFFASRLESLLEMLKENNAMMILCMRYAESLAESPIIETLLARCASKVLVPDDLNLNYAAMFPALISENEQDLLCSMQRTQGDIMVKQGHETVALRINLDNMPDVSAIFGNDVKTLLSAGGPFAAMPGKAPHG
ncbi:MAG: hypothetical protein SFX19_05955 [Alphaproteobacteria bacterium]|nr:hypothetical protein [Alphaproteobacteria bacterium]